jgi:hypothetical protein
MKPFFQKSLALVLIASALSFFVPAPARAGYWGEDLLAATYKQMLEEVYVQMKETIISNLKMVAIRTIQSRLSSLLGSAGGGGGSTIISNWQNFIYISASQYSMQVTNDFFNSMKSGLPSPVVQRIVNPAKTMAMANPLSIKPDLQNFVQNGDASKIFAAGFANDKWTAWRRASMPQNDPTYLAMVGAALKDESARQKEVAKTAEGVAGAGFESVKGKTTSPATSGGYTAYTKDGSPYTVPPGSGGYTAYTKDGSPYTVPSSASGSTPNLDFRDFNFRETGNTVPSAAISNSDFGEDPLAGTSVEEIMTPGSTVKDTVTKVQSMPIDMLAMARSVPEIATSMVTSILTQMMNQGISMVTSKISGQIGGTGEFGSAIGGITSGLGSAASNVGGRTINTSASKLQNMIQSGLK